MPHEQRPDGITMVMLNGLTTGGVTELLPLAKSWLNAPPVSAHSAGFESKGFDRLERAFVLVRRDPSAASLDVTLQASPGTPLVNPALLIRNWNASQAKVRVNGRVLSEGSALRTGVTHHIDGADLVVFVRQSAETPLRITVSRD